MHASDSALTTKLLYGRAFRAPAFNEMYYENNPSTLGNEDLVPETIDTFEVAFEHRTTNNLNNNLNLYRYKIEDLISGMGELAGVRSQNATDQDGYGFELESDWQATPQLRLQGHYAWQHSEDAESGKRTPNAPRHQAYIGTTWAFSSGWQLGAQVKWIGDRVRAATDSRPLLKNYTIVDFKLRRTNILPNADLAILVHNVFDEDAREPSAHNNELPGDRDAGILNDLPMEGRSLFGELSYHF